MDINEKKPTFPGQEGGEKKPAGENAGNSERQNRNNYYRNRSRNVRRNGENAPEKEGVKAETGAGEENRPRSSESRPKQGSGENRQGGEKRGQSRPRPQNNGENKGQKQDSRRPQNDRNRVRTTKQPYNRSGYAVREEDVSILLEEDAAVTEEMSDIAGEVPADIRLKETEKAARTEPGGNTAPGTAPIPSGSCRPAAPLPTVTVVGVVFKRGGKVYYFDPGDRICKKDDHVIVDTTRGTEFGIVSLANREIPKRDIVSPLRRVIRAATAEDEERWEKNREAEVNAFNLCIEKIADHRLDMKLVDVEMSFDNSKLLFYFTAEGRVDFRDLVKDLASAFRTRIELRQIGIRDEAKLMGGLGICGRPYCCASFLPDFVQVSIKMAKEQNLSLNSAKISGACGRLMCCLRYEYDTYLAESAITPKPDSIVDTPKGEGVVSESNCLTGLCKVILNNAPQQVTVFCREELTVKGSVKKKKTTEEAPQPEEVRDSGNTAAPQKGRNPRSKNKKSPGQGKQEGGQKPN